MTITQTPVRSWDVPAEPEGVTTVQSARGDLWRITDEPGVDPGTMRWTSVKHEDTDDELVLSWRSLVRLEGPLTEVAT